jgi:hypothetical protein
MPELTDRGRAAMAKELLAVARNEPGTWDRETPELRQTFLDIIDQLVVKASEAEERASR